MSIIKHGNGEFVVDDNGYLVGGPDAVNDDWIDYVMNDVGIVEMTTEHWEIFNNMQEHLMENDAIISIRRLSDATKTPLKRIFELFIYPVKGLCKMTGSGTPLSCNVDANF